MRLSYIPPDDVAPELGFSIGLFAFVAVFCIC